MKMKNTLLILFLFCSVFLLNSCSQYDDMGDGNTTGGDTDPRLEEKKAEIIESDKKSGVEQEDNGNTGGGNGDPRIN